MKRRILCEFKKKFGEIFNPCRKVLCDIVASEITLEGTKVVVVGFEQAIIKCPKCKQSTVIKIKEGVTNV